MPFVRNNARLKLYAAVAVVMITSGFEVLVNSQYMIEMNKAMEGKALTGSAFRNLTMKTVVDCFLACLKDCLCISFQMCNETECQLLSSSQFQSTLDNIIGCTYYDMFPSSAKQVGQTTSCSPGCLVNPCQNGGSHESLFPANYTKPRFKCNCPMGYTGNLCRDVVKSCRGYINGRRVPGLYMVFDDNMNPFDVFCDFDLNSTMTWTLVLSYELRKKDLFHQKPFNLNFSVDENTPRWDAYRLSKPRMQSIQNDSSNFRMTCNYDTEGVVFRDYLQAANDKMDIITFDSFVNGVVCIFVEWINIRGQECKNCTAVLIQGGQHKFPLHFDSCYAGGQVCEFRPNNCLPCNGYGEDNFGVYDCVNPAHRCSSSQSATTQTWFGGN